MDRNKELKKINYIIIFMVIYLSSSFYGLSISGSINIILSILISIIAVIANLRDLNINKKATIFIIIVISASIITLLFQNGKLYDYLIFWVYLLSAYLVYISIDLKSFIYIFNDIMYFLCIFSIITFLLLIFIPEVFSFLPTIRNSSGLSMKNVFFSVVYNSNYFNSNFGLFWEPGAYQTFINVALFFQLFLIKEIKIKKILIYLITIFTTFSTTGYISAFILILIFLFINKKIYKIKENKFNIKKLMFIIILILVIGFIIFNYMPDVIKFKVFGKLEGIFNPHLLKNNSSYESTLARVDAFKIPIYNMFNSPIIGVGFNKLSQSAKEFGSGFLTTTPINWFALFGIPIGILINFNIWRWSKVINKNFVLKILLIIFLVIIISSENYNRNAFYLLFILYGFNINKLGYSKFSYN